MNRPEPAESVIIGMSPERLADIRRRIGQRMADALDAVCDDYEDEREDEAAETHREAS